MDQKRSKAEKLNESGWVSSMVLMMSIYVNGNHSAGNLDHPEAQSDGGKTSLSQNMGKQELPSFLDLVLIFVGKVCILDWWVDYVI